MTRPSIDVVLCWHMHQPEYRDPRDSVYQQPWTYLHAVKDYVDMAAHLERWPNARAVVNFVPILLEQLDDYATRIADFAEHGKASRLHDPVLMALADPRSVPRNKRLFVLKALTRANQQRMIARFPAFEQLVATANALLAQNPAPEHIANALIADLAVWYHLAWLGETVRQENPMVQALSEQDAGFAKHQRHALLGLIGEQIASIFPRYAKLAAAGRIELSMTPYAHPIVPLLLDLHSGQESRPQDPVPQAAAYPEPHERVMWHLQQGRAVFKQYFQQEPTGVWPSEGALSAETVALFAKAGVRWLASGQQVLQRALDRSALDCQCQHQVYQYQAHKTALFFRDDGLSDLIGFDYQNWHADDAVADLQQHIHRIADICAEGEQQTSRPLVPIILDGENAWEYYPDNGFWLLEGLYKTLSQDPRINLTTFDEHLKHSKSRARLEHLPAGSWVHGDLATWVGNPEKNRAWDYLVAARKAYRKAEASQRWDAETQQTCARQLAVCEGSDWFWWFGGENPAQAMRDFDQLFRLQLTRLYTLIKQSPPEYLQQPICTISTSSDEAAEAGGVMRRGS